MYSFNLDYIFNLVYNLLLAIRYAILFWILRINPADYLEDHKYDAWDGLRDRGWIKFGEATGSQNPGTDIVYLGGSGGSDHLSWWDNIKLHIFGIGNNNVGSIKTSGSTSYGLNPADVNYAANKTSNDPWIHNLKFSIQNPILSFLADVLTILAFFVLLILIYSIFKWYFLNVNPITTEKEEARRKKLLEEKSKKKNLEGLEKLKSDQHKESKEINYVVEKEEKIIESMPAGIPGLPIDESQLTKEELKEIDKKEDLLMSYETKNIIPEKENQILKTKKREDVSEIITTEKVYLSEEDSRKKYEEAKKLSWYKERWDKVIGYMEGGEEAVWRIGVLEADNLLDDLLADRGYVGLTMAEKLKQASFNTIDLAWSAHKIRNRIAHDGSRFILTDRIARNTLELYRSVFKEFKVFE